eukprot:4838966-Heterocapsa_arctica.AAC.1
MFFGRPRRRDSEQQIQWEVSLWENIFPGANPSEAEQASRTPIWESGGRIEEGGRIAQSSAPDQATEERSEAEASRGTEQQGPRSEGAIIPVPPILIIDEPIWESGGGTGEGGRRAQSSAPDRATEERSEAVASRGTDLPGPRSEEASVPVPTILIIDEPALEAPAEAQFPTA